MKKIVQKITFVIALASSLNVFAQGNYELEIEQKVQGSNLLMDLYIHKVSGVDFPLSSCNFAVFIDTANLDINNIVKVASEDGPWDNGTVPSSYLDLILGKGANFINLSTRRNTTGSIVGYNVTSTRTKIGQVSIPIKNACGTNNAVWNSGPVAQTMMPLTSIKNYASFKNANPDFPLCELPAQPFLTNVDSIYEVCEGDVVTLSTDATSEIQWYKDGVAILGANSTTYKVSASGSYTVEAVNCTACRTAALNTESIIVNPLPAKPSIELIGNLLSTDAIGIIQWYKVGIIQWYKDGVAIEGANTTTFEPLSNGVYTVINSNTCGEKTSDEYKVEMTSVAEVLSNKLIAYPNPYKGSTIVSYTLTNKNDVTLELFDALGKQLATLENTTKKAGEYNLNFSASKQGFSEGIYFIKLTIGQETKTIKLVELK